MTRCCTYLAERKKWICDVFAVSSGRWCNRKSTTTNSIQFKPNTPNTPNAGRAFSLSHAIFLSMMILVCTYNVICCVVHEHFVVFDYFIYFVSEQTASYPIALEKLSIRYLSTSVSRSAYNVTATMWLATAPQKEKSIATLWFFITVMQFLNGLLNIMLCNFTNERNCSNSPSSIRWFQ